MQSLGPLFLNRHNLELIKAPVIALVGEYGLGRLYKAGSRIKQKALELHQDCVEEARLDCLVIEIVEQKKEAAACCSQLKLNLQKKRKL